MSKLSEQVRKSLYTKMNVSGVTSLANGGIHYLQAPSNAVLPYVVFSRLPRNVSYQFNGGIGYESDLWLIKAITDNSHSSKSAVTLGEEILQAVETAIGESLTLTNAQSLLVRRTADMPSYTELESNKTIHHQGFFLTIYSR